MRGNYIKTLMTTNQKPYAILLCHILIEFVIDLGVPEWVKSAIASSLESGSLAKIVERALEDAYKRGELSVHQSITPIVEIPIDQRNGSMPPGPRVNRPAPRQRTSTAPWYRKKE